MTGTEAERGERERGERKRASQIIKLELIGPMIKAPRGKTYFAELSDVQVE